MRVSIYLNRSQRLFVLLLICFVIGCKHAPDDPLSKWDAISGEPLEDATILQQAEDSHCVWKVSEDYGSHSIKIEPTVYSTIQRETILQNENGTLIGTNHGEFGGDLLLKNGSSVKHLLSENVLGMLRMGPNIIIFTGLRHLDINVGSVWRYSKDNKSGWVLKKLYELPSRPYVMHFGYRGILVITSHNIFRIDKNLAIREIATMPLLHTYPNSIFEDIHGTIYIGMNAFVVRLIPTQTGYTHEWFTMTGCLA